MEENRNELDNKPDVGILNNTNDDRNVQPAPRRKWSGGGGTRGLPTCQQLMIINTPDTIIVHRLTSTDGIFRYIICVDWMECNDCKAT